MEEKDTLPYNVTQQKEVLSIKEGSNVLLVLLKKMERKMLIQYIFMSIQYLRNTTFLFTSLCKKH